MAEFSTRTKLVEPIGIIEFSILLSSVNISFSWFVKMAYNVLHLPQGGNFGALHCQPSTPRSSSVAKL